MRVVSALLSTQPHALKKAIKTPPKLASRQYMLLYRSALLTIESHIMSRLFDVIESHIMSSLGDVSRSLVSALNAVG